MISRYCRYANAFVEYCAMHEDTILEVDTADQELEAARARNDQRTI